MIAILLAPVYLLVSYYVLRWTLKWMGACHRFFKGKYFRRIFIGLYVFGSTAVLTSFLIKQPYWLHRVLKQVSNFWMGVFLYAVLAIAAADLVRLILRHTKVLKDNVVKSKAMFITTGTVAAAAVIALSVWGLLHARHITTSSYEVEVAKQFEDKTMTVVLAADMHLGYSIGEWHMRQMVDRINEMDADVVCFAGDIFDNEFDSVKNPDKVEEILRGIKSKYGVYACYGNHDLDEPILAGFTFGRGDRENDDTRMEEFLKGAGITLLNDEAVCVDDKFYLAGRRDFSRARKVEGGRKSPEELLEGLDKSKPVFVIDHQPKELDKLAAAGADLDLSGHTHDGQLFPGNLLIGLMWKNPCGHIIVDGMDSVVTSGVGVWGPNMRVGTDSEVVKITVNFQQAQK